MEETKFNTIEEALADLQAGKIIVTVDDPDRENEGDLVCAAEFATLENVNFMASYAKGLICIPMSRDLTEKLNLQQMVANNTDNHATAFTVSIDHVSTTTGISALERSVTAMKCVAEDAKPADFRRPGHMFPLEAKAGGVLERMGHTDADCRVEGVRIVLRDYAGGRYHDAYDGVAGVRATASVENHYGGGFDSLSSSYGNFGGAGDRSRDAYEVWYF